MSKLYVTVRTDRTSKTATAHHWAKATLQSWDGSVQITLDEQGNVEVSVESGSTPTPGYLIRRWKLDDLLKDPSILR